MYHSDKLYKNIINPSINLITQRYFYSYPNIGDEKEIFFFIEDMAAFSIGKNIRIILFFLIWLNLHSSIPHQIEKERKITNQQKSFRHCNGNAALLSMQIQIHISLPCWNFHRVSLIQIYNLEWCTLSHTCFTFVSSIL